LKIFFTIFGIIGLMLAVLMCWHESRLPKINFFIALLLCIVITPLFAYLIISSIALRFPVGCVSCDNTENEAEICGCCGKLADGGFPNNRSSE
jgi:hypothetical protein